MTYGAPAVMLPLGLLYGFIMQPPDTIWGPISIHAVIDLISLLGVLRPPDWEHPAGAADTLADAAPRPRGEDGMG